MRKLSLTVFIALLTAVSWSAGAQEELSSPCRYAIEVTCGDGPLFRRMSSQSIFSDFPSYEKSRELAEKGQEGVRESVFFPTISVNWVFIGERNTDIVLSARVAWCNYAVVSHPVFGTDPKGKPRYELTESTPVGRENFSPAGTITVSGRHTWASAGPVDFFLAVGGGFCVGPDIGNRGIIPEAFFSPLGIKIGHGHFYGLAEVSLGICSPWCQGGIGWRF
jgi:hypothetical protein